MLPDYFVPVKVILPRPEFDYRDKPGGGSTKCFVPVTAELRGQLVKSLNSVEEHFQQSFESHPDIPAVAKVALRPKAHAKSHHPTNVFDQHTCPIVGGDAPGELLISVNDQGIKAAMGKIRSGSTKKVIANISAIAAIVPFSERDVLDGETAESIVAKAKEQKVPVRLRMFRHPSHVVNQLIDQAAESIAEDRGAELRQLDYGEGLQVFAVDGATPSAIREIANFQGTQNISLFPTYTIFKTASHVIGTLDSKRFPPLAKNAPFGVVGIFDSGTDQRNAQLQQYVIAREDEVPLSQQDNDHGTFVAGLIANPRSLNNGNMRFPSVQSKIVDIVIFDKSGEISEWDLIEKIDKAVKKYPQVRVWNLSLGQNKPCKDHRFTPFGLKLDSIARKRKVLFVIAAGNYEKFPLSGWPIPDRGEDDRIGAPADSVRSLTVGSIAHVENDVACAKLDQPSPFTRRGPGPHFYLKPEVSGCGGNCAPNGDCLQSGVVSVRGKNSLAENIGTSFAAPSVSTLAANIFRELEPEGDISPTLVKALIVHSAFVKSGKPSPDEMRFRGLGCPGDLYEILNCTKSSATLIFHAELAESTWFDKANFPIPICLQVPKVGLRAEIFATLAYDPPTDARYGIEYCRTNVTASLGIVVKNKKGKKALQNQLRPVPKDITKGYEDALVKDGFKWSPLKLYHREFEAGPINKRWRLHLGVLGRSGYQLPEAQKATLIVTIRDPKNLAFVYNAVVQEMSRLSWGAQDLRIASRIRGKSRG